MKCHKAIAYVPLLFLIFVVSRTAEAQMDDYGFKGGLNHATISKMDDAEYFSGIHFGAFVLLRPPFFPVGFQPEILYTQLGASFATGNNSLPGEPGSKESLIIEYIQFPALLRYYLRMPGPVSPHLFAGPYFGLKANVKYPQEWDSGSPVEMRETIREQDHGLVFGIGTDIHLILATFQLDARYTAGLQKLFNEGHENGEKLRSFSVSIGLAF